MRKKVGILFLVLMLGALAACGAKSDNKNASGSGDEEELKMLEVDLQVTEEVAVDERVDMKATVTFGSEEVKDADEVVFEVWEEGKKSDSEMIDATNHEDGTYTAETNFDHDGLFHIQVHVTARDMHTMPLKEVTVGDGGHYEEAEEASADAQAEHGDHGDFHTEGFGMHFMDPEAVKVGEAVDLMTHIQLHEEALADLNVRYEIWDEASHEEQHAWVDAEEGKDGEYTASHTFEKAGTYKVQVHVEDDEELHEHQEFEIVVEK
ncbi:FixH family protein [Ornithinibacillus gellani]|uniref:FixH family protein n=1 Tax=Ornithinibacillus gellani TaxID=2293253 RepID=UPI000F4638C3|nr:FixH family protein [Ornithinibacillus gellani]TQS71214.1 FixH family protein [Ornithinibacillus gellani]